MGGQVLSGVVVEANHGELLKVVQNKLQISKKELKLVVLCCHDFRGLQVLPQGDLSAILKNDAKIIASLGEPTEELQTLKPSKAKKVQKAVDALVMVKVGNGALAARGRPNFDQLAAMQHHHGVTGVITLLRENEGAAHVGQACKELGLKWVSAPLRGPKKMMMSANGGGDKPCLTPEELDGFMQVRRLRESLEVDEDRLIVHCAAGLHRTGIFLYLLLRELGESPEGALEKIVQMRQETFDEFVRLRFQAKAEAIFALVSSESSIQAGETASCVEVLAERPNTEDAEEYSEDEEESG